MPVGSLVSMVHEPEGPTNTSIRRPLDVSPKTARFSSCCFLSWSMKSRRSPQMSIWALAVGEVSKTLTNHLRLAALLRLPGGECYVIHIRTSLALPRPPKDHPNLIVVLLHLFGGLGENNQLGRFWLSDDFLILSKHNCSISMSSSRRHLVHPAACIGGGKKITPI